MCDWFLTNLARQGRPSICSGVRRDAARCVYMSRLPCVVGKSRYYLETLAQQKMNNMLGLEKLGMRGKKYKHGRIVQLVIQSTYTQQLLNRVACYCW